MSGDMHGQGRVFISRIPPYNNIQLWLIIKIYVEDLPSFVGFRKGLDLF